MLLTSEVGNCPRHKKTLINQMYCCAELGKRGKPLRIVDETDPGIINFRE